MKLVKNNTYGDADKAEISVKYAIEDKLNQTDYYYGNVIANQEKLNNVIYVLSELVNKLIEKDVLKLEDINSMIGHNYEIVKR